MHTNELKLRPVKAVAVLEQSLHELQPQRLAALEDQSVLADKLSHHVLVRRNRAVFLQEALQLHVLH